MKVESSTLERELSNMLAHPKQVQNVTHHASLPYEETPKVLPIIDKVEYDNFLRFKVHHTNRARTSEVIGARFDKVNFEKSFWCIPQERMKTGLEHKVPLSKKQLQ